MEEERTQQSLHAPAVKLTLASVKNLVHDALYNKENENNMMVSALIKAEKTTKVKREQLAYGGIAACVLYLALGNAAGLVCNLIGFGYPAYASFKAIRTENKDDDTHWLTYWIVFATFSLFDQATDKISSFVPFYWLLKCAFLLFLYLPTYRGAECLYQAVVGPLYERVEQFVENQKQKYKKNEQGGKKSK